MRTGFIVLAILIPAVGQAQFSFYPPVSSPTQRGPVAMATADFNGDGIPDLVVSDTGSHLFSVSLGHGDGTFRLAGTFPVPSTCQMASLFVGDFTGHHKSDLLGICLLQNQVLVFPGRGDGTFGAPIPSQLPALAFAGNIPVAGVAAGMNATIGDFNRDGKLDLMIVLFTNLTSFPPSATSIYFIPGNGDGTFRTGEAVAGASQAVTVRSGDFNDDGILDLAYLTATPFGPGNPARYTISNQALGILFGNGNGTFRPGPIYPWTGATFALSVADVNGDGFLDLYSVGARPPATGSYQPTSQVTVMLGDGVGNFRPIFSAPDPKGTLATSYCLADFSGTGTLDLLETFVTLSGAQFDLADIAGTELGLRHGIGNGGFDPPLTVSGPTGMISTASVCADFNGDGVTDIAYPGMPASAISSAFQATLQGFDTVQGIDQALTELPAGELFVALSEGAAPARTFRIENAASYASGTLAANSIASISWNGPKNLSGIEVNVRDSAGQTRAAQILFISSTQINYLIPAATALGQATVTITGMPNPLSTPLKIAAVAPGIFNAGGLALGYADTVYSSGHQTYASVSSPDASGTLQLAPIDVSSGNVYLLLFGTGIRNHVNPVTATIGSTTLPTTYAGAQGSFPGEDQINIALPASLAGAGVVDLTLSVDGQTSNSVQIQIK
jgi:uncharacterized protein (TIGR03437 family)